MYQFNLEKHKMCTLVTATGPMSEKLYQYPLCNQPNAVPAKVWAPLCRSYQTRTVPIHPNKNCMASRVNVEVKPQYLPKPVVLNIFWVSAPFRFSKYFLVPLVEHQWYIWGLGIQNGTACFTSHSLKWHFATQVMHASQVKNHWPNSTQQLCQWQLGWGRPQYVAAGEKSVCSRCKWSLLSHSNLFPSEHSPQPCLWVNDCITITVVFPVIPQTCPTIP